MEAGTLAKQALTLAPDLAEAHVALGLFHYYGFREYEPALTEFQRAIELQPNYSLALSSSPLCTGGRGNGIALWTS